MRRLCVGLFAVLAIVGPLRGSASAHGHRDVAEHEWTVGWANEPAFVGFQNAVQLVLSHTGGGPVEGAEKDLRVTVSIGDAQTEQLELRTVFDAPGEYRADLIPTVPGDYTFHFTGTLDGEKADQSFTGSKDDFAEIETTSEIAFPKQAPTNAELAERLEAVDDAAADAVTMPRTLGIAGVILALVAIVLAVRPRRTN